MEETREIVWISIISHQMTHGKMHSSAKTEYLEKIKGFKMDEKVQLAFLLFNKRAKRAFQKT